ncbi:MAG TPA: hypothetical protein VFJ19_20325 [Nocardioidaceae bacterium]|nr:hypothetical protein [Nocardioidaceae bacterium]
MLVPGLLTVSRRAWVLPLIVFVVSLAIYVPTVARSTVNTDVAANSMAAWRLAHTGKPWMDGLNLHESGEVSHYGVGADGHIVTTRTPGQIWAATPFYLGSPSAQPSPGGTPVPPTGFFRSGLAAAMMTAAAMALLFLALRRHLTTAAALGATAVVAFTTPVWTVSANALWTHPLTVLAIAGAAYGARRKQWWAVGIWLGIGMLGRAHVAVIAAIVGLGMAWHERSLKPAVRVAIPTLVSLLVLSVWDHFVFGTWDPRGAYSGHTFGSMVPGVRTGAVTSMVENWAGFLVSPDKGFFVWTPVALLLLPAVVRGWRAAPAWSRWLALGGLAYAVVQLGLNGFTGGDGFQGYRLALEPLVCLTPLYAFTAARAGMVARVLAPWVMGIQAGVAAIGAFADGVVNYVNYHQVWQDNSAWKAFREQPVAAGLVFAVFGLLAGVLTWAYVRRSSASMNDVADTEERTSRLSAAESLP